LGQNQITCTYNFVHCPKNNHSNKIVSVVVNI
jgi:hypothetical protein